MTTYNYVAGDHAELVVGDSVELVTVRDTWACQHREVEDSAGRKFVVSEGALRPALPDDFEVVDDVDDKVRAYVTDDDDGPHKHRVRIVAECAVDLTPDQADQLADAVRAMARAIRGRDSGE